MNKKRLISIIISVLLILTTVGFIQFKVYVVETKLNNLVVEQRKLKSKYRILTKKNDKLNKTYKDISLKQQQLIAKNKDLAYQINEIRLNNKNLTFEINKSKEKIEELTNKIKIKNQKLNQKSTQKSTRNSVVKIGRGKSTSVREIYVMSTAYTAFCKGCSGKTTTGLNLRKNPNLKIIAVDPNVIPLGSKVWVEGYGYALAADTGGAIKGYRIDVFIPNESNAYKWGIKRVKVKILQ